MRDWRSPFAATDDASPFAHEGLGRRAAPFVLLVALAEASLALQPGTVSLAYALTSVALLLLVCASPAAPWPRWPRALSVAVPIALLASIVTLIIASGSATTGVNVLLLAPVLWTALFHRRWESYLVVALVAVGELIISFTPVHVADAVLVRRVVFWGALALLVSVSTHDLRDRLRRSLVDRETRLRRVTLLELAARDLTAILEPDRVLAEATRLAATLVDAPDDPTPGTRYLRVDGESVVVAARDGEPGDPASDVPAIEDHRHLREVLARGAPAFVSLVALDGPEAADSPAHDLGPVNVVYVPVRRDGRVDGVLAVPTRRRDAPADLLDVCGALGHVVELAWGNAVIHQTLIAQATTDALTGLPNRRSFDGLLANLPGRSHVGLVVVDLDGLKEVNDDLGHAAGDELLVAVARALQESLRRGDVVARVGGDEFYAILLQADATDAEVIARRMLERATAIEVAGQRASVSVGVAAGPSTVDPLALLQDADRAMYVAKRQGGSRYVVAGEGPTSSLSTSTTIDPA